MGMTIAKFAEANLWRSIVLEIEGKLVDFVIFNWSEIKAREEDSENTFTYFIGSYAEAYQKLADDAWIPFAAGNMYALALQYDGGFSEMANRGLLYADVSESNIDPSGSVMAFVTTQTGRVPHVPHAAPFMRRRFLGKRQTEPALERARARVASPPLRRTQPTAGASPTSSMSAIGAASPLRTRVFSTRV